MGPAIILDKSAFESLSPEELFFLYKYFNLVVPRILVYEILGDLSKNLPTGVSTHQVSVLANKFFSMDSNLNVSHYELIEGELLGEPVLMDYRPLVVANRVVTREGKKVIIIEPSEEEVVIQRWRDGNFTAMDIAESRNWRESTLTFDLVATRQQLRTILGSIPKVKDIDDLTNQVDLFLSNLQDSPECLHWVRGVFGIESEIFQPALDRYNREGYSSLKDFSPYTAYCFRVTLIFYLALANNIVGPRATNALDVQYLYYLPFCEVFVSGDKLHKKLCPLLVTPDQMFIDGKSLKHDLAEMAAEWNLIAPDLRSEQWSKKYGKQPPPRPKSPTYQAWENSKHWNPDHDLVYNPDETGVQFEEPDVIEVKRTITIDDPCPCGSGKNFKDCHLPMIESE